MAFPQDGVNTMLTVDRRGREVETDQYARFVLRILDGLGRRIAQGDVEALATVAEVESRVREVKVLAMRGLHREGYSWAEIARPLGLTKQAAQQLATRTPPRP